MKEEELREVSKCISCGKASGSKGSLFYRVRIQTFMLNLQACRRQQGLGMMLGGHGTLAMVMGPNEDLAEQVTETEVTLCSDCAIQEQTILELQVKGLEDSEKKESS